MSDDADRGLAGLPAGAVLRDGTAVCVRTIRPDDKEILQAGFARLSSRSVYQRFFHPVRELVPEELRRVTEVDLRKHVTIVLTVGAGRDERLIAVGQYVRSGNRGKRAEVAFTVADEYQSRGAATLLLRELTAVARARGIRAFVADVLDDNRPMLEVFRHSSLPLRERFADGHRRIVLSLAPRPRGAGAVTLAPGTQAA